MPIFSTMTFHGEKYVYITLQLVLFSSLIVAGIGGD